MVIDIEYSHTCKLSNIAAISKPISRYQMTVLQGKVREAADDPMRQDKEASE